MCQVYYHRTWTRYIIKLLATCNDHMTVKIYVLQLQWKKNNKNHYSASTKILFFIFVFFYKISKNYVEILYCLPTYIHIKHICIHIKQIQIIKHDKIQIRLNVWKQIIIEYIIFQCLYCFGIVITGGQVQNNCYLTNRGNLIGYHIQLIIINIYLGFSMGFFFVQNISLLFPIIMKWWTGWIKKKKKTLFDPIMLTIGNEYFEISLFEIISNVQNMAIFTNEHWFR